MQKEVVKNWLVPSDLSEIQKISAKVLAFLKPLSLSEAYQFDVRLCLEEALINAMKYGNQLRRSVPVSLRVGYDSSRVWIRVEDQGDGFDVKELGDCTRGDSLTKHSGRGVHLIHQLMDEVQYNDKGNEILMVKLIQNGIGSKSASGEDSWM